MPIVISPPKTSSLQPVTLYNQTSQPIVATPESRTYQPAGSSCAVSNSRAPGIRLSLHGPQTIPARSSLTVVPHGHPGPSDVLIGWHVSGSQNGVAIDYNLDSQQVILGGGRSSQCAVAHHIGHTIKPHALPPATSSGLPVTAIAVGGLVVLFVIAAIFGLRHRARKVSGTHASRSTGRRDR
jgi:hypothetical protein